MDAKLAPSGLKKKKKKQRNTVGFVCFSVFVFVFVDMPNKKNAHELRVILAV